MFQRRRRETRFHIERLEGRDAPGIFVTLATVPKESGNGSFTIHGYTTGATIPGDHIRFKLSSSLPKYGAGGTTVRAYSIRELHRTGEFTAEIAPDYIYPYKYHAGTEVTIVAWNTSLPEGHDDRTTERVRIELV
jgi:hypothetical protein